MKKPVLVVSISVSLVLVVSLVIVTALSVKAARDGKKIRLQALIQLQQLSIALEHYHVDTGHYPEGRDSSGIVLYKALSGDGVGADGLAGTKDDTTPDGKPDAGANAYLGDLDPAKNTRKMVVLSKKGVPIKLADPLGNPWQYRSGREAGAMNPDYDLWSFGPDGKDSTKDDVRNW